MQFTPDSRARLRQLLAMSFSWEELKTMCFDLGLDPESIGGSTKDAFTREVVLNFERRGQLDALEAACAQRQSKWPLNMDMDAPEHTAPDVSPDEAPKPTDEFNYDAFVSYATQSASDADWVWRTLLPTLSEARFRVAVSGDFEELGVVQLVSKERGITHARRTVIVLSPAYMRDNMAEFENLLAQSKGVQEGTARLLPITIAPLVGLSLPARLSMLVILDLTQPWREAHQLARLIRALRDPLPRMK